MTITQELKQILSMEQNFVAPVFLLMEDRQRVSRSGMVRTTEHGRGNVLYRQGREMTFVSWNNVCYNKYMFRICRRFLFGNNHHGSGVCIPEQKQMCCGGFTL